MLECRLFQNSSGGGEGKEVSLLELFYDLVFVYAVSRMTSVLEEVSGGPVSVQAYATYFLAAFAVLQIWLFQTNYNNRFGNGCWYENLITCLNMMAVLYMANTIKVEWREEYLYFDASMIFMLLSMAVLYLLYSRKAKEDARQTRTIGRMLLVFAALYGVTILITLAGGNDRISYAVSAVAAVAGVFAPAFLKKEIVVQMTDFPHFTERFELLTIVTFGEMIVGVSNYFRTTTFNLISIGAFVVILLLFGSYVIHDHYLIDRNSKTRGLTLMFSHVGIVIALNFLTVGQVLIFDGMEHRMLCVCIMAAGTLAYYLCMFANSVYYGRKLWTFPEKVILIVIMAAGLAVMLLIRDGYGCLIGMLVMAGGAFFMLVMKYRQVKCQ